MCFYVKGAVANAPAVHNIPVIQLESKTALINEAVEYDLAPRLWESFGVTVSGVDIGAIENDKCDRLMAVPRNVTIAMVQAQIAANIKDIRDKQCVDTRNYKETLWIQREEGQYAQRMQTRTVNFGTYQVEKQAELGVAGANTFGRMNANGAGNVNMSDGMGINPTAMMAGMAMGGAMGQNFVGMMNKAMSGLNQAAKTGAVPPPLFPQFPIMWRSTDSLQGRSIWKCLSKWC